MSDSNEDPKTGVALSDGPVHNPDIVLIRKEREDRRYRQQLLSHTLSRKNLMAFTGFFLCFFLVIHLFGNLQLLLPAEVARWQFNFYSKLLSENLFIELISYVLFASILAHAIYALLITIQNRRSNKVTPKMLVCKLSGAYALPTLEEAKEIYGKRFCKDKALPGSKRLRPDVELQRFRACSE